MRMETLQEGCSFLKKRTKKLLFVWSRAGPTGAAPMSKSFLLLFFKKEVLSFLNIHQLHRISPMPAKPKHLAHIPRRAGAGACAACRAVSRKPGLRMLADGAHFGLEQ
jgi:hypothetical protein